MRPVTAKECENTWQCLLTLAYKALNVLRKIDIQIFRLVEHEADEPHCTHGIPVEHKHIKEENRTSLRDTLPFKNTYGSGWIGSNCSGLMWASVIWSLRSKAKIKCRIFDSTSPTHSSWSSTLEELAIRTIKCLSKKKIGLSNLRIDKIKAKGYKTYLYLMKKLGGSNSLSHVAFPIMISSVIMNPWRNSSCMTVRVEHETLNVEFCWG